jgi:hypothetical protein
MFFRKRNDKIVLGKTGPFGIRRFWVREAERATHTYVVGITGKGKSKLLEHILFQDITQGRGCGVLDPHSDLVEDLLATCSAIPGSEPHWHSIIYFDPSRTDYMVPFNVLIQACRPMKRPRMWLRPFGAPGPRRWPRPPLCQYHHGRRHDPHRQSPDPG